MNILAIDYGKRWVGLAIGNTKEGFAVPLETIDQRKEEDMFGIFKRVCLERDIEKIIVGLPVTMAGKKGESAEAVNEFVKNLEKEIDLPIELVDERLTSKMTHGDPISFGDEHSKAAALLLMTFLEK